VARSARLAIWLALLAVGCANDPGPATAQARSQTAAAAPAAPVEVAPAPAGKLFSAEELDELVARVALYPDPLLGLVLPASTNALQIVQAQRFLEADTGAKPPESWDPAIISLLNYPDVVKMMSDDLDWTQALGDAVSAQQADVMDAVQQVRAQAKAAGNLETSKEQKVIVEQEVVKIVPADPEVIYVPQYNPQYIYVPSPAPVVSYYPPAPCYWCPAAAFGTAMFVGAATTAALTAPFWAFDWHRHDIGWGFHGGHNDFDFDIDRDIDINNNFNNSFNNKNVVNKGNGNSWKPSNDRPGNRPGGGGGSSTKPIRPSRPDGGWNNPNRPGGGNKPATLPSTRPGGGGEGRPSTRPGAGGGGTQRPGMSGGGKDRPGSVAGRPSTQPSDRPSSAQRPGSASTRPSNSFGGYDRGQSSIKNSQRGASSRDRSSMGSSSSRQPPSSGSGSYRSSGGGGSGSKSMGNYQGGSRSSASSSRGSYSRGGGGGGGSRGGGGGSRGGGGGRGGGGRR
jgi:hypothetical protein